MKKLLSCLLLIALALSCAVSMAETAPATIIGFADGNYAFFGVDTTAGNADACELSVVDYKGGKALRVDVKSQTTAQITFEEIAEVLGEDVSTWGARMQCESSGAWSVYSVTVGQAH